MDLHLARKRALITGGTKGIGRAIAFGLAAEGCDVALCARDATAVAATVADLQARDVSAYGEALDVGDKAALFFYVKSLARHVAAKGIRANVVSPGTTYFEGGYWDKVKRNDPERFARNVAENPFGRMATPQEIADVVVFLSSARASFVSGSNVVVDGTLTMRIPN